MKIFPFLVALLVLCGCQTSAPRGARLTRAQAIGIAERVAAEQNQRLQDYRRPQVRFDSETRQWEVYFPCRKNSGSTSGFNVTIDDETGGGVGGLVNVAIPQSKMPPNTALEPTPTAP